jgi:hypothetical protein
VNRERGDVSGLDDTADRERGAQLIAALFDVVAEQRRR